jgi:hypothetical protein
MKADYRCIEQLLAVKNAISDKETAYVTRLRLRRMVLGFCRMIAKECGIEEPVFPIRLKVPSAATSDIYEMTERINRLIVNARLMSQPSEPESERWEGYLAELGEELRMLESLLKEAT